MSLMKRSCFRNQQTHGPDDVQAMVLVRLLQPHQYIVHLPESDYVRNHLVMS